MKYTIHDALNEIKKRAKIIRKNHEKRITNFLMTSACLTLVVLIAVIGTFSNSQVSRIYIEYGSIILSPDTGKYVLIATLGFVLGVLVTFVIKQIKKDRLK